MMMMMMVMIIEPSLLCIANWDIVQQAAYRALENKGMGYECIGYEKMGQGDRNERYSAM